MMQLAKPPCYVLSLCLLPSVDAIYAAAAAIVVAPAPIPPT
jgi:hypothetical protein